MLNFIIPSVEYPFLYFYIFRIAIQAFKIIYIKRKV